MLSSNYTGTRPRRTLFRSGQRRKTWGNLDLAVSVFVRGILGIILAMALGMGLWVVA